jgi:hypothetical protein
MTTMNADHEIAAVVKAAVAAEMNALRGEVQDVASRIPVKTDDDQGEKITQALSAHNAGQKELNEKIVQLHSDSAETRTKLEALAAKIAAPKAQDTRVDGMKVFKDSGLLDRIEKGELGAFSGRKLKLPSLLSADGMTLFASTGDAVDTGNLGGLIAPSYDTTFRPGAKAARPFATYAPKVAVNSNSHIYSREDDISVMSGIRTYLTNAEDADHVLCTLSDVTGITADAVLLISHAGTLYPCVVTSVDTATKIVTLDWTYGHALTGSEVVVFQDFKGVAEQAQKPYTALKTTAVTATLDMVAMMALITKQADVLTDCRRAMSVKLPEVIARDMSFLSLIGGGNIPGLMTTSGVQSQSWGHATGMLSSDSRADAVLRAWAMCLTPGPYRAWMDRHAWLSILTAKGASEKAYLMSSFGPISVGMASDGNGASLGWLDVGFDDSLIRPLTAAWATYTQTCIVIDHARAHAILHNPAMASLEAGVVNDDFELNQFRLRYEEMLGQAIYDFKAYCVTEFDHVPA